VAMNHSSAIQRQAREIANRWPATSVRRSGPPHPRLQTRTAGRQARLAPPQTGEQAPQLDLRSRVCGRLSRRW
jgi:hypothetical protein